MGVTHRCGRRSCSRAPGQRTGEGLAPEQQAYGEGAALTTHGWIAFGNQLQRQTDDAIRLRRRADGDQALGVARVALTDNLAAHQPFVAGQRTYAF